MTPLSKLSASGLEAMSEAVELLLAELKSRTMTMPMATGQSPLFLALVAAVFAVVVWLSVSHVSGWASLAQLYRCEEGFFGDRLRFRSAAMRYWSHYGNCLTMGANPQGLFLSISVPFFVGHPPLFIPWSEIAIRRGRYLWSKYVELRLGRELAIPFRISQGLGSRLAAWAGGAWPEESATDVR
jgi:hypothetical protein